MTARGVVTGGGFSLLSEAVYLGKPVLSVPLRGQFEQLMNARYLEREGFGICAPRRRHAGAGRPSSTRLDGFHETARRRYEQDGNAEALAAIEASVIAAGADTRRDRARARRAARRRRRAMNDAAKRGAIAGGAATAAAAGIAIYQGQYPTAQLYGATIHRERGAGKQHRADLRRRARTPSRPRGCSSCSRATTRRRPSSSSASGPRASRG